MKKIGLILMLGLFVTGCSKDQRSVNKLEGTWNATHFIWTNVGSESIDEVESGYLDFEYTFEACKLKKEDEGCALHAKNIINSGGPSVTDIEYTYIISEDGTKMTWIHSSYEDDVWDIESLTSKNFIISHNTPSGEAHVEIRWEKE